MTTKSLVTDASTPDVKDEDSDSAAPSTPDVKDEDCESFGGGQKTIDEQATKIDTPMVDEEALGSVTFVLKGLDEVIIRSPVKCTVISGHLLAMPMCAVLSSDYLPSNIATLNASNYAPILLSVSELPHNALSDRSKMESDYLALRHRLHDTHRRHAYRSNEAYQAIQAIHNHFIHPTEDPIKVERSEGWTEVITGVASQGEVTLRFSPCDEAGVAIIRNEGPVAFYRHVTAPSYELNPDGFDMFNHVCTRSLAHHKEFKQLIQKRLPSPIFMFTGVDNHCTQLITQQAANLTLQHYPSVAVLSLNSEGASFGTPSTATLTLLTRQWIGNRMTALSGMAGTNNAITIDSAAFTSGDYSTFADLHFTDQLGAKSLGRILLGSSQAVHRDPGTVLASASVLLERWRILVKAIPIIIGDYAKKNSEEYETRADDNWRDTLHVIGNNNDRIEDDIHISLRDQDDCSFDSVPKAEYDSLVRCGTDPACDIGLVVEPHLLQLEEMRTLGIPLIVMAPGHSSNDGPLGWQTTENLLSVISPTHRLNYLASDELFHPSGEHDQDELVKQELTRQTSKKSDTSADRKFKVIPMNNLALQSISRIRGVPHNFLPWQSYRNICTTIDHPDYIPTARHRRMFSSYNARVCHQYTQWLLHWRPLTLCYSDVMTTPPIMTWDYLISGRLPQLIEYDTVSIQCENRHRLQKEEPAINEKESPTYEAAIGKPVEVFRQSDEVILSDIDVTKLALYYGVNRTKRELGHSMQSKFDAFKSTIEGRLVSFCQTLVAVVAVDQTLHYRHSATSHDIRDPLLPNAVFEHKFSAYIYRLNLARQHGTRRRQHVITATIAIPVLDLPPSIRRDRVAVRRYLSTADAMIPCLEDMYWTPSFYGMGDLKAHCPPALMRHAININKRSHLRKLLMSNRHANERTAGCLWIASTDAKGTTVSSKKTNHFGWSHHGQFGH